MPTETAPAGLVSAFDSAQRAVLKDALLKLFAAKCGAAERGLQFEGLDCRDPKPTQLTLVLILQEILVADRSISLIQWPGGAALVRTADVDSLRSSVKGNLLEVNEESKFIVRGGSADGADLASATPIVSKTIVGDA